MALEDDIKAALAPGRDYDLVNNPSLALIVKKVNAMMARVQACATAKGTPLTQDEIDVVGAYYGAHVYAMSDQTYASKSTAGASGSFHGQTGLNLDGTKYGQEAKSADPSGCLTAIASGKRAGGFWAGKRESDALTYDERN